MHVQQNHQKSVSSLVACCVCGVPLCATFTILNYGYVRGTVSDAQSGYSTSDVTCGLCKLAKNDLE